jgi:hypothetical protein
MHDGVIAHGFGLLHVAPGCGRMGAGGQNRKAMLGGDLRHGLTQEAQFLSRGRNMAMRERCHLDLRLQQFSADLTSGRSFGCFEECRRHGASRRLGVGLNQKKFFFDSEPETVVHDRAPF